MCWRKACGAPPPPPFGVAVQGDNKRVAGDIPQPLLNAASQTCRRGDSLRHLFTSQARLHLRPTPIPDEHWVRVSARLDHFSSLHCGHGDLVLVTCTLQLVVLPTLVRPGEPVDRRRKGFM